MAESEAQLYASRGESGFTKLSKGTGNTDLYTVNGTDKYIAHMIGTTSSTTGRFTWAWGYLPGEETGPTIVHDIRTQGEKLGIPELAEADFASEPRLMQRVLQASAAISRIYTPVVFQTDNGDTGYFLIDGFQMPPATVTDLRQTIETVMAGPGRPQRHPAGPSPVRGDATHRLRRAGRCSIPAGRGRDVDHRPRRQRDHRARHPGRRTALAVARAVLAKLVSVRLLQQP